MQEEQPSNPIQYILNSPLSGVLSKGFAELYNNKPDFPVSYLANWLKQYSKNQKDKKNTSQLVNKQSQAYKQLMQNKEVQKNKSLQKQKQCLDENEQLNKKYSEQLQKTQHLEDLLKQWIPQYFQSRYKMTGAYVGHLTHPHKALQMHNFQPNSEYDSESPKIIQYIGTSVSHQPIMHMKILPAETGVSYQVFNEPQPQPEQEQQDKKNKIPKKRYLYISDVTKNQKIKYFKFPKLGSYACFPLKIKSYLSQSHFEQCVEIYKQYIKQKQQTERQYQEKINEARQQYDDATKKYQDYQAPQQPGPQSENDKAALKQEMDKTYSALNQLENNPPSIPDPDFTTIQKCYLIGIDTLGQDRQIPENILDKIDQQIKLFKKNFEQKQRQMLLDDILAFIDDQAKFDAAQNVYRDIQKNALSHAQEVAKQKTTKQKQLQYETSLAKCKKMESVFEDQIFEKSMKKYTQYHIPKYKQVLQIGLMLVGYSKQQINIPRSNQLDFRKIIKGQYIQNLMEKIADYNLRPKQTPQCHQQYKISKLLSRLEKIDLQQVIKYNSFIWALIMHLKNICWCRLQCRDSHNEAYQMSVKAKQQRDAQIQKFKQELEKELQKAIESHKAEAADNQNAQQFKQQEWRTNYLKENIQPQPLEIIQKREFLDLD